MTRRLNGADVDTRELATTLRLLADAIEMQDSDVLRVGAGEIAEPEDAVVADLRMQYTIPEGSERLTDPIQYVTAEDDTPTASPRTAAERAVDRVLRTRLRARTGGSLR